VTTATTGTATLDPSVLGLPASVLSHITIKNNLAAVNPMAVGTHLVTWTLYDDCNNEMTTCTQNVTVKYEDCDGTITMGSGENYHYKRIGYQCWFTENLREPVGVYSAYNNDAANVPDYGYLYTWYTAAGVPENDNTAVPTTQTADDGTEYVQGICPAGWSIGSESDYTILNTTAVSAEFLKDPSTLYWIGGFEGTAGPLNTGFNARGSGRYNSTLDRYEDFKTAFFFWRSDSTPGSATVVSGEISYYCDSVLPIMSDKHDKRSVRCVRKKVTP